MYFLIQNSTGKNRKRKAQTKDDEENAAMKGNLMQSKNKKQKKQSTDKQMKNQADHEDILEDFKFSDDED